MQNFLHSNCFDMQYQNGMARKISLILYCMLTGIYLLCQQIGVGERHADRLKLYRALSHTLGIIIFLQMSYIGLDTTAHYLISMRSRIGNASMPPMEERVKCNKKHFQIQSQISHVTVRAYDGEKLYKIRQFPIRHSPQYSTSVTKIPQSIMTSLQTS